MAKLESTSRLTALLIDDDPIVASTVADGLRRSNFDVTVATRGADGLDHARRSRFSIAILDYAMPEMDGGHIAGVLGALSQPFMFLAASSDEHIVARVIAAGALAYVVKPVDPLNFGPTVRAAALRGMDIAALTERADRLARRIDSDRDVSVCVGLIMVQRGVSREVAYETLRQHARRTRRRLPELAAEMMQGTSLLFGLSIVDPGKPAADRAATSVADST